MASVQAGAFALRMNTIQLSDIWYDVVTVADPDHIQVSASASEHTDFYGSFQYDYDAQTLIGGTLNSIQYTHNGQLAWTIGGLAIDAVTYEVWLNQNATSTAMNAMFGGQDDISGSSFDDELEGLGGNDTIKGGGGNDQILGGDGDDILDGGAGNDVIDGGAGIDKASYFYEAAAVSVNLSISGAQNTGGGGVDTLNGIEGLIGSQYDDTLVGNSADNVLLGEYGDDLLIGGAGSDRLDGGGGQDTASFANAGSAVSVDLRNWSAQNTGGSGTDTLISIESAIGSAFNDVLVGSGGSLSGGAGDDLLNVGDGVTLFDGGAGIDTASFAQLAHNIEVALSDPMFVGIENLTGTAYSDGLTGDGGANVLSGGGGNDFLDGGGGADRLDGGVGLDTASYEFAASRVTVSLAITGPQNTLGAGIDTLVGVENLLGSDFNDVLTGDAGANQLDGGAGDDQLYGGGGFNTLNGGSGNDQLFGGSGGALNGGDGDDTLEGGSGVDTLDGGSGTDTASYAHAAAGVTVDLRLYGPQNTQGAGVDSLFSIENLIGSAFNDVLTGANGATVNGGAGDDVLHLGGGELRVDGGAGVDTLSFADDPAGRYASLADPMFVNIENLAGGSHNDNLTGNNADNVVSGGAGDDTLEGLSGSDRLDGGAGVDTAGYSHASAGVTVSLAVGGAQDTGGAGSDTLVGIEDLVGSNFGDVLTGDSGDNDLSALGGNDQLFGGAGADRLKGGSGDDILEGGQGDDTLDGTDGSDTASYTHAGAGVTVSLNITSRQDTHGAGSDVLVAIENLTGSDFKDVLTGSDKANVISGGAGDDVIDGGPGDDVLDGGDGTDTLSYASSFATVIVSLASTKPQNTFWGVDTIKNFENLTGSSASDQLTGDANNNILTGGEGSDVLDGGAGDDRLEGGNGTDSAAYLSAQSGVVVDLTLSGAQDTVGAGKDTLVGIESAIGSNYDDVLTGTNSNNVLDGRGGDDLLDGGDTSTHDLLMGGAGIDTVTYAHAKSGVSVSTISGGQNDELRDIENLIGSSFDDTLSGSGGANVLAGGGGDDVLQGNGGDDTLDGGAGDDTVSFAVGAPKSGVNVSLLISGPQDTGAGMVTLVGIENLTGSKYGDVLIGDDADNVLIGGGGEDVLEGGGGNDTLVGTVPGAMASYAHAASGVHVDLRITTAQDTLGAGIDTLQSMSGLIGSAYDDVLMAGSQLRPFTLNGGAGDDLLQGGSGADILIGGTGIDTVTYANAANAVTVNLNITKAQPLAGGGDKLSGIENVIGSSLSDQITGNGVANVLNGMDGNDVLIGGAGADVLAGGAGRDQLKGGDDADDFAFGALADSTAASPDRILDFQGGADRIDLSGIDADAAQAGDQAFHLGATIGHAGDIVVHFDAQHHRTVVELYTDSDAVADSVIWLDGNHALSAADFVL